TGTLRFRRRGRLAQQVRRGGNFLGEAAQEEAGASAEEDGATDESSHREQKRAALNESAPWPTSPERQRGMRRTRRLRFGLVSVVRSAIPHSLLPISFLKTAAPHRRMSRAAVVGRRR